MSNKQNTPSKGQFNAKNSGSTHASTPVKGQMKVGEPAKLSSRAGRFSGTGSDVRSEKGRFSGGAGRQQRKAGGDHGLSHGSQPQGHSPGTFASTAHKGHTK